MKQLKVYVLSFFALFLSIFGLDAFAVPPDFTDLTEAVDFSTAVTAIMTVFAAVAVMYIVMRGGRMILSAIGGR